MFAFIPDDGSATYVIDVIVCVLQFCHLSIIYISPHQSNSTQALSAPANKDPQATYFASTTALVQLSSSGSVSFLPFNQDSADQNANAEWSTISNLPTATTNSPSGNSGSSAGPSATSGSSNGNSGPKATQGNSAVSLPIAGRWMWAVIGLLVGTVFL
jgi:hypothetical protein